MRRWFLAGSAAVGRTSLSYTLGGILAQQRRALLLDEPITAGSLGRPALILLGVAVGAGPVRLAWRSSAAMQEP